MGVEFPRSFNTLIDERTGTDLIGMFLIPKMMSQVLNFVVCLYWQLNMEVTLDPEQIPNLKEFVSYLSQTMHSSLPGSLVIW